MLHINAWPWKNVNLRSAQNAGTCLGSIFARSASITPAFVQYLNMERIDAHTHCVPPSYREYCLQSDFAGNGHPDGMPAIPVSTPRN
jgi:hypothetical protein